MISGGSETLGYAAEALVLHGDLDGAQEQLRQAFEIVNTYGERIYLPQLLLTEAAINRARGRPAEAEASIRRAVAETSAQGVPWLELLALTELCEVGRRESMTIGRSARSSRDWEKPRIHQHSPGQSPYSNARARTDPTEIQPNADSSDQ